MFSESPNFQENIRTAFSQIVSSPENTDLVTSFLKAQKLRSDYPWLGESGNLPGNNNKDGVAYAIRFALSLYIPKSMAPETEEDKKEVIPNETGLRISTETMERVLSDKLTLSQFADCLQHRGVDVKNVTASTLRYHITAAFEVYIGRANSNLTSDPW